MTNDQLTNLLHDQVIILGSFPAGSPEWHELRNQPGVVSGSEMGAICGTSPFTSAITLWAEKTGRVERDFVGSDAMRLGQLVEPAIRQLYMEKHPTHKVFEVDQTLTRKGFEWGHANLDGIAVDEQGVQYILEIKHTSQYWDEIPLHYKQQVLWYMFITGIRKSVFAVVNAGRYKEYAFDYDGFEFSVLWDRVLNFRNRLIDDVQPDWDGSESTYDTTRKLVDGLETRDEELGQLGIELFNAQDAFDEAETYLREMKSRTIEALNGAKNGVINGKVVCSLQQRAGGLPYLTVKKATKK
jgi:putative phage-type endonuclease